MVAISVIQYSDILLHTAQGRNKTQKVENALTNLYADDNATPTQIELESATSIPEGITARKYYK